MRRVVLRAVVYRREHVTTRKMQRAGACLQVLVRLALDSFMELLGAVASSFLAEAIFPGEGNVGELS